MHILEDKLILFPAQWLKVQQQSKFFDYIYFINYIYFIGVLDLSIEF